MSGLFISSQYFQTYCTLINKQIYCTVLQQLYIQPRNFNNFIQVLREEKMLNLFILFVVNSLVFGGK
jgi:hypothetical protein